MLRDELLEDRDDQQQSLPGLYTGPLQTRQRPGEQQSHMITICDYDGMLK